jgi:hypothetical protein
LKRFLLTILLTSAFALDLVAQNSSGVRGTIKSDDGSVLSFATIFVKQMGTGTTANEDGNYELALKPGRYDLVFQHLGRKTEVRIVEVKEDFLVLNITLIPQDIVLQSVTIDADDEDPAYSIMRKAIAKANYHRNLLDTYSARVYIKGAGKLKDYPWLAKKALQKEGIEKNRVYISESVSDIKFTRPNKFEEKVISIRSDGKDNNTSPNGYIFGSFYEPEVAETISPLSPKSFSYYRFEYQGTFKDRDYDVSRIKVIPRSKGDNVVDGMLYIVEEDWAIHSLDIHTMKLGIDIWIQVMCGPIEDKAWLPVSHKFKVDGKVFGFEFEYNYLATVSGYKIAVNPKIYVEKMQVIDEKVQKDLAKEVQKKQQNVKQQKTAEKNDKLKERLASGEEITRKELKTLVKEYEKEERKTQKDPEVLSDMTFKIDSGAYKKDSAYWATIRPIPLTKEEVKGYEKADSIAAIERAKEEGDTIKKSKHQGFQPWDIILGDNYKIGKHSNFRIYTPMGGFNTVEGLNLIYKIGIGTVLQDTNRTRVSLTPVVRYSFAREKLSGYVTFRVANRKQRFELEGGRYIHQFNADNPILPIVNSFTTLFLEKNLMKIYERDFVEARYRKVINPFISVTTSWNYAERSELFNNSDYKLIDVKKVEDYTPNRPINDELNDYIVDGPGTGFPKHQAFIGSIGLSTRPWLKYRIRNGWKYALPRSSPTLLLDYRKGFGNIFGSDVDFDQLELGVKYGFKVGARGDIDFALRGGMFLNSDKMYFMDFKHFLGNKTPFSTTDPVGSFRLLDYYRYSTSDKYFVGNVHYQFRKFLVTTIPYVRLAGIRENIFLNYLATPTSGQYTEAGYSIDGILRFFRLEGAVAFRNGVYIDYGFRIGIATTIAGDFVD